MGQIELAVAMCRLLGLDPETVQAIKFEVDARATEPLRVEVLHVVKTPAGGESRRRYKVVPVEECL